MKRFCIATSIAMAMLAVVSCSSEQDDFTGNGVESTDNQLIITGDCAIYEVANPTGAGWHITSVPDWITPVAASGAKSEKIMLYVESNTVDPREASVEVRYDNGASRAIAVTQSTEQTGLSLQRANAVGWGIDVRTHRDSRGLTDQIFNAQKVLAYYRKGISNEVYTHTDITMCYGSSYEEFQGAIAAALHIDIPGDAFSLDLEGAFGKNTLRQSNRAFSWARERFDERRVAFELDPVEAAMGGTLTADFQKQFDEVVKSNGSDESIRNLIDRYGTHYVKTAYLGGYLDYYYSYEHSEMSDDMKIEGTLKCAFNEKFSLNGDVTFKDNLEMLSETAVESFRVMGGDAMWLTNLVVAGKQSQEALDKWAATLNVDAGLNASIELIDFELNSISDLFMGYSGEGIPAKINNYINRTLYYSTVPVTRSN